MNLSHARHKCQMSERQCTISNANQLIHHTRPRVLRKCWEMLIRVCSDRRRIGLGAASRAYIATVPPGHASPKSVSLTPTLLSPIFALTVPHILHNGSFPSSSLPTETPAPPSPTLAAASATLVAQSVRPPAHQDFHRRPILYLQRHSNAEHIHSNSPTFNTERSG